MKLLISNIFFLFIITISSTTFAFDCGRIEFGTPMSELDDGFFVPYMEKGGVTYYNYTGPCRMGLHEYTNPAISFAFVDDRIYARLIRTFDNDIGQVLAKVEAVTGPAEKMTREGDWLIYHWSFPKDLKSKIKYNEMTHEIRSAIYYEPLRDLLKAEHDPAS